MGNVERVDKTLPTNVMIYYVRKDARLRERWKSDLEGVCQEFGLSEEEIDALKEMNPKVLMDLGVHQYLIPHLLRLTYGETGMTNTHPALTDYQKAFPTESKAAIGDSKWDINKGDKDG
jgi:Aromatic-ring-opening dioxygenase LigAB, LigA subunit